MPTTLPRVLAFAESQPYPIEVVVVNNASTDRTSAVVQGFMPTHSILSLLDQPVQGKGAAARKGMLEARGDYRFICDADLAMPVEQVVRFIPPQQTDFDVAIASREVPGSKRYSEPWYRHGMGRVFNWFVRLAAVPGIQDTQCGFKCLARSAAHDIFSCQRIDGWAFDVEILYIARQRNYRVVEVPIDWYYGEGSRVSPVRDSLAMVREVFRIRRLGRRGAYDR